MLSDEDRQLLAKPPQITLPLPTVLIYQCQNPRLPKYSFLAAFEQRARGDLIMMVADGAHAGLTTDIVNQWTGATAEEASDKAKLWWYKTFDLHREVLRRGSHTLGLVWLNRKSTGERVRCKEDEVQGYLDQGYKHGRNFV